MKDIFIKIGFVALIMVTFVFTEKTALFIRDNDELMKKIKDESSVFKEMAVDAIIEGDTIIPGKVGVEVDYNETYKSLKRIGSYNKSYLKFKDVKPNVSLSNTYDKFVISGNKSQKEITLLFLVKKNTNVNKLLNKIKQKDIKVSFFMDSIWLENNNELSMSIFENGHNLGNLSYEENYEHEDFLWIDTIFKRIIGQKNNYCYSPDKNKKVLEKCALYKNHTISPTVVIKENPSHQVKEKLQNGSIIAFEITDKLVEEFDTIVDYINSKGFVIKGLEEFLKE